MGFQDDPRPRNRHSPFTPVQTLENDAAPVGVIGVNESVYTLCTRTHTKLDDPLCLISKKQTLQHNSVRCETKMHTLLVCL